MKRLLIIVAILIFSMLCLADSPPSWGEFKKESQNRKYIARVMVDTKEVCEKPWKNKYRIIVSKREGNTAIWSCQYLYDGYPEGILSDDGSIFAYVSVWYRERGPLVFIYYKGLAIHKKTAREFNFDTSKLVHTASHKLWLAGNGALNYRFVNLKNGMVLEIVTIDGKKHLIDARSGKFRK